MKCPVCSLCAASSHTAVQPKPHSMPLKALGDNAVSSQHSCTSCTTLSSLAADTFQAGCSRRQTSLYTSSGHPHEDNALIIFTQVSTDSVPSSISSHLQGQVSDTVPCCFRDLPAGDKREKGCCVHQEVLGSGCTGLGSFELSLFAPRPFTLICHCVSMSHSVSLQQHRVGKGAGPHHGAAQGHLPDPAVGLSRTRGMTHRYKHAPHLTM